MVRTRFGVAALVLVLLAGVFAPVSAQMDDEITLLYWQAASILNPYLSGGTKDLHAASVVLEPLARYDESGALVPWLVDEIPTLANGGIAEDLTSITWTLSEGITWSDGSPLTSADVVFTWEYCVDPDAGCNALSNFADVESVEAMDDLTVTVSFGVSKPFPYGPFVSQVSPIIQAAQFADCVGANAPTCTDQNFGPIGTGPYVVDDFRANDVIVYTANPNYREAGKPYFQRVVFKGGGDAESAARAVLETGEADYAWNLQISPAVLGAMEAAGQGSVVVAYGSGVERLMVNQTNPSSDLGDDRSIYMDGANAHPFLTNAAVWQALSMAVDRGLIASQLYGSAGRASCNVLAAPAIYASSSNDGCLVQDVAGANAMLDEAGVLDSDGDGVRELDGVPLSILYQTSTNAVRQSTQALIKQWWAEIGVETELRNIDAAVFFGGDPASPDTYGKFYADIEMYTNSFSGTDPESYMGNWVCGEVSGPDNNWLGNNIPRWCNTDYEALVEQMSQSAAIEDRASLAMQMNDMVVQAGIMIPLVHRGDVSAHANSLDGILMNAWDSELWNIADWTRMG